MTSPGSFALYENPRAGTLRVKLASGEKVTRIVSVLGIWTDGEARLRYLVVGCAKGKDEGGNPRWVPAADLDIYVGQGR